MMIYVKRYSMFERHVMHICYSFVFNVRKSGVNMSILYDFYFPTHYALCCWYSKVSSYGDDSFEYQQHRFWKLNHDCRA